MGDYVSLEFIGYAAIVCYLLLLVWFARFVHAVAKGRIASSELQWSAWRLAAVSFFGGALLSWSVSPDWNPFVMFGWFVPAWACAVWAAWLAHEVRRGLLGGPAIRHASLRALLTLPLAPLGAVVAFGFWAPGVAVAATILWLRRPGTAATSATSPVSPVEQ